MIFAIIISLLFYRGAVQHNLNKILWPAIGFLSYLGGQLVVGFIIGALAPDLLDNSLSMILFGLISGIAGVGIAYRVMLNTAKKNAEKKESSNPDLIDDFN